MPTFKLDGKPVPFEQGETIIHAAWRQGIEIPHYCWHPGLTAPANCRMCLVEILPKPGQRPLNLDVLEWDPKIGDYRSVQKPKLQPSCYMGATDGMEVLADTSEHVRRARHDVQEFLLLNHPVDCPICDQSGECKLQDYWLDYGRFTRKRDARRAGAQAEGRRPSSRPSSTTANAASCARAAFASWTKWRRIPCSTCASAVT